MLLPRFPLGLTSSPMNAQWVDNLPVSLLEINLISQSTVLDNTVTEITWVCTSTPRHTSNTNEPPPPTPEQYDTLLFRVPRATAFLWANTELGWGGGQWGGEPPYDFLAKHKRGSIWIQNRLSYLGERSELRGPPAFAAPLARFSRVFSRYPPNGELARRIIQNKVFSQNVLSKIAVKEPLNHPRYDTVAGKILGALKNISGWGNLKNYSSRTSL